MLVTFKWHPFLDTPPVKNSLINGEVNIQWKTGKITKINYIDGKQSGLYKKYNKTGNIVSTSNIINGIIY